MKDDYKDYLSEALVLTPENKPKNRTAEAKLEAQSETLLRAGLLALENQQRDFNTVLQGLNEKLRNVNANARSKMLSKQDLTRALMGPDNPE